MKEEREGKRWEEGREERSEGGKGREEGRRDSCWIHDP